MSKKAVFFDIDGTLCDRHMKIEDSTKAAIQKLHENGHYAFLCSGRSKAYIKNPELLGMQFDGIIAGCGTHVEVEGKDIVYKTIPRDILNETFEILQANALPAIWEGKDKLFADVEGLKTDPYFQFLKTQLGSHLVSIQGNEEQWEVNKMTVTIHDKSNTDALELLEKYYYVMRHDFPVAELLPLGYSKATGVKSVCEYLDIAEENTYAFGDSVNDLDMLKNVAYGIAMGNGSEQAKEAAVYVTSDIHENGIWNGLEHYSLI